MAAIYPNGTDIKAGDLVEFIEDGTRGGLVKGNRVRVKRVEPGSDPNYSPTVYYDWVDIAGRSCENNVFSHRLKKVEEEFKPGDLVEFIDNRSLGGLDKGERVRVNKVESSICGPLIFYTRPDNNLEGDLFAHRFKKVDEEAEQVEAKTQPIVEYIVPGDLVEFIEDGSYNGLVKGDRVRVLRMDISSREGDKTILYYDRPDGKGECNAFITRFKKVNDEAEKKQKLHDLKVQILANNPCLHVKLPETEPTSKVFHIDIGDIPAARAEEFMDRMKVQFQKIRNVDKNPTTWFDGLLVYFFTIDAGMLIRYILSHL